MDCCKVRHNAQSFWVSMECEVINLFFKSYFNTKFPHGEEGTMVEEALFEAEGTVELLMEEEAAGGDGERMGPMDGEGEEEE